MNWISIPMVAGSVVFGLFGFTIGHVGVLSLGKRSWDVDASESQATVRRIQWRWIALLLQVALVLMGVCMLSAAVLLWTNWRLAIALGLWPLALIALVLSPKLGLISCLSVGGGEHSQ